MLTRGLFHPLYRGERLLTSYHSLEALPGVIIKVSNYNQFVSYDRQRLLQEKSIETANFRSSKLFDEVTKELSYSPSKYCINSHDTVGA